jgi:lipid II:glycine glycyltransferase (peptidoglycan interpeptide bridge formation enzyme)
MYVLDLPELPDELRFGNRVTRHRIKGAVNRALKLGVQVRRAETEKDLKEWFDLYLETMRWHGSVPRPYRFFKSLWNQLHPRNEMRILLAELHHGPKRTLLSGYMFLMCGKTIHCFLNGRRRDQLGFHPNDILQWQAIQDACREGFRRYDFGEVEEGQQGLIGFKVKWGAKPIRSYRYYYPASKSLPDLESSDGLLQSVTGRLWRHVPLRVTSALGDWIYSYL